VPTCGQNYFTRALTGLLHGPWPWVLRHKAVTSALIGASKVSQVDDCVGAARNLNFSNDKLAQIESILSQ
jgi:aryl-alcohol dehydrogenase-like predicted oxidoreductase